MQEIYICNVIKARALDSDVCKRVLQRTYPTAPYDFVPVSLLMETKAFYHPHEPSIIQDVFEKDSELGQTFHSILIDVLVPGQPLRLNQTIVRPKRARSDYAILDDVALWLGGEYRHYNYKDILVMDWGCEHLFTKRRADGSRRRHAPPHVGGRLLHELKYGKLVQVRSVMPTVPVDQISRLAGQHSDKSIERAPKPKALCVS